MEWRWNGLGLSHLTDDCPGITRVHLENKDTNIRSLWACGLREVVCGGELGGACTGREQEKAYGEQYV